MARVFTTDRLLHFGSVLFVGAWTVAAFAALAAVGTREAQDFADTILQFVSWLMPVIGVYGTWTYLKMPYTVILTDAGQLHFESILGRQILSAAQVSRVRRDRLGWFVTFESADKRIQMLSRITGLWSLLSALHERNNALQVDGL